MTVDMGEWGFSLQTQEVFFDKIEKEIENIESLNHIFVTVIFEDDMVSEFNKNVYSKSDTEYKLIIDAIENTLDEDYELKDKAIVSVVVTNNYYLPTSFYLFMFFDDKFISLTKISNNTSGVNHTHPTFTGLSSVSIADAPVYGDVCRNDFLFLELIQNGTDSNKNLTFPQINLSVPSQEQDLPLSGINKGVLDVASSLFTVTSTIVNPYWYSSLPSYAYMDRSYISLCFGFNTNNLTDLSETFPSVNFGIGVDANSSTVKTNFYTQQTSFTGIKDTGVIEPSLYAFLYNSDTTTGFISLEGSSVKKFGKK